MMLSHASDGATIQRHSFGYRPSADQARILGAAKGAALLVREHTIFDTKGRALLHGRTYYAGKFSVRYTLGPTADGPRPAARAESAAAAQPWAA